MPKPQLSKLRTKPVRNKLDISTRIGTYTCQARHLNRRVFRARLGNMIVGIDEVGRGCWAGPLVAGAVVLDDSKQLAGLRDSKKLTKQRRTRLAERIAAQALAVGLGWVTAAEIDAWGLTQAVRVAMQRALAAVQVSYDQIIIDGAYNFLPENSKSTAIVRADNTVPAVSAASIVAKVARDAWMSELGENYAVYQFEKHVGYGTALHRQLLDEYGVSDLHRLSFKPVKVRAELVP